MQVLALVKCDSVNKGECVWKKSYMMNITRMER